MTARTSPSIRRWLDRVAFAGLGSALTLVVVGRTWDWERARSNGRVELADPLRPHAHDVSSELPPALTVAGPSSASGPGPVKVSAVGVSKPDLGIVGPSDSLTNVQAPASTRRTPPTLDLARMPGTNRLSATATYDASRHSWVLIQAFRVPAALGQVEAFYRHALANAKLTVRSSEVAADDTGARRWLLKGRSPKVHCQVSIRQPQGTLKTRVRVLWRVYD